MEAFETKISEPYIVKILIGHLFHLEAYKYEGIFRKASHTEHLQNFCSRFREFDYDLSDCDDPYLTADLLKKFLRNLKEPVFPKSYYQKCIDIAEKINHNEDFDADSDQYKAMDDLLFPQKWIPDSHIKVLRRIAGFVKVCNDPEHITRNKMSLKNFAMMLAPSLIKSPATITVQSEIIRTKELEFRFIEYLFRYLIESEQCIIPRSV
jgi:hypothetical protein